ncbi:J domain-containing protein [Candidatus Methylopumilus planktonicus]|uniref:J domain-containing protein n=1 Tax=Candidatus Methylopumilus planktonicus TaxID=1581557 RepID=UPI00111DBB60|nr:J domain-containing protein [Candidatus Methylopumilus planktonicus]QDD09421.1 J domain-containing protein [Candidatus Methylopumilus planktonicus]
MTTLPEEEELLRLESEQKTLEEKTVYSEMQLETERVELSRFQIRYYQTIGKLYSELDKLDARIAKIKAGENPDDEDLKEKAKEAQEQAKKSFKESEMHKDEEIPPEITADVKKIYRKAAMLMHPDRATNEIERKRRDSFMAKVNIAYEKGDQKLIEQLINEFGSDPEVLTGDDIASKIVKSIRRIAQLRRRLDEVTVELEKITQLEMYQLKITIHENETMGGKPLEDLQKQLMQEISEKKIILETLKN